MNVLRTERYYDGWSVMINVRHDDDERFEKKKKTLRYDIGIQQINNYSNYKFYIINSFNDYK